MLNFDQQVDFARAMSSSFTEAASSLLDASSRMFAASPPPAEPTTSWYRPPVAANPFDWTTWVLSTTTNPWSSFGWTQPSWFGWSMALSQPASINPFTRLGVAQSPFGYQPWAEMSSFAGNMAVLQSSQQAWAALAPPAKQPDLLAQGWEAMAWSLQQTSAHLDVLTKAADTADAYASYRSSSGHAVAQIVIMDDAAVQATKQGSKLTAAKPVESSSGPDDTVH